MKEQYVIGIYDLEGNFLQYFSSISECAEIIRIQNADISKCINDRVTYAKYFQFVKRKSKERLPSKIGSVANKSRINSRPVAKYFNNKLISVYNSLLEASNKTGIAIGSIGDCCSRGNNHLGFEFRYLDDILNQEEYDTTRESTVTA